MPARDIEFGEECTKDVERAKRKDAASEWTRAGACQQGAKLLRTTGVLPARYT